MRKSQKSHKSVTSIDGLARLMQGEFLGVHGRLDGVDERLTTVDERLTTVDERLTTVDERLTTLERGMDEIKENSSELFAKLDEFISLYRDTKQELTVLAKQVKRLEERMAQLEARR